MQTKKISEISDKEFETYTGIILYSNGDKYWFLNGKLHRTDGPAVEWANGSKEWFLNGKHHRTDGPAVEWVNGDKYWYYQNKYINVKSQEEFEEYLKNKNLIKRKNNMSTEQELISLITEAITYQYPKDKCAPGILTSKLKNGEYYVSVQRFEESFGKGKKIVCKAKDTNLVNALKAVAAQIVSSKETNPVDNLSAFIKSV